MKIFPRPKVGRFIRRYRTMIAGFNVYRLGGVVSGAVAPPRIHTVVHGMMTESEAEVVATGDYGVLFRTNPRLLVALSHTGMAFVQSPLHGMVFRARVLDVREKQSCVALTEFELVPEIEERRSLTRVAPMQPVVVRLYSPDFDLRGRVADVSVGALAANFGVGGSLSVSEHTRSQVRLITSLLDGDTVKFTGRIHRIDPKYRNDVTWWRVVVDLGKDTHADRVLNEYVRSREAEILSRLEHEGNAGAPATGEAEPGTEEDG